MGLFSKIRGTIESIFQLGGPTGPQVKNNGGVIEARNAGDSGFVVVRGASPVGRNDLTPKFYVDTLAKPIIVSAQFDGNAALPANSGTEKFYITTTSGPNSTIGELLFDDGSGAGTVTVLAAVDARVVITTMAFTGGTISLLAESMYAWDSPTSTWINAGGSQQSGAIREIRYAITNAATQDSATFIEANSIVVEATLNITTPYSGGATISVGRSGSLTLLQATTDNHPQVANMYQVMQDTSWGGTAFAVRVTVGGAPAAGAGVAIVKYTLSNS